MALHYCVRTLTTPKIPAVFDKSARQRHAQLSKMGLAQENNEPGKNRSNVAQLPSAAIDQTDAMMIAKPKNRAILAVFAREVWQVTSEVNDS